MNAQTGMLHVRIDNNLKAKATEALEAMGLSASEAVRLLFHRIATDQAFPLELKVPNAASREALAEVRQMKAQGLAGRIIDAETLFAELDAKAGLNGKAG
jgi:DNA-damage-inducible protein J